MSLVLPFALAACVGLSICLLVQPFRLACREDMYMLSRDCVGDLRATAARCMFMVASLLCFECRKDIYCHGFPVVLG